MMIKALILNVHDLNNASKVDMLYNHIIQYEGGLDVMMVLGHKFEGDMVASIGQSL